MNAQTKHLDRSGEMKIWNILETAEEVKTCLDGKPYELLGTITDPVSMQPHAYLRVKNYGGNDADAVFLVPMMVTPAIES